MKTKFLKNFIWLLVFTITPFATYAQEQQGRAADSYFSNALFNALGIVIILLLVLIAVIANVIKNVARSDYFKNKVAKQVDKKSIAGTTTTLLVLFLLMSGVADAQETIRVAKGDWLIGGLDMFTFYAMITIILFEVSFLAILLNILKGLLKSDIVEVATVISSVPKPIEKTILDKLNASVEIGKEEEIMLDHNYDGIRELDNDLPPWWKYGFALSIVVAIIYFTNYHLAKTGDLQLAEYNKELTKAKIEVDEYLKTSANNVDETTVKLLDKSEDIETGKQTFISNCVACHGKLANGKLGEKDGAGPNLTDNYWLHGGGIQDIFKSIKYGWTEKGMKSWKEDLSPVQIAQVASYIKSLKGSSPVGKAPQGEMYQDAGSPVVKDTLAAPVDSVKLKVIVDSLEIVAKEKK